MKLLYATGRYNPLKHDEGSGEDYNLYQVFLRHGFDITIVGPLADKPDLIEKVYRKAHGLVSSKRYAKYSMALLRNAAAEVKDTIDEIKPDALFSHNLSAFVKLETQIPIVYLMDAPLMGAQAQWPVFSNIEYRRMLGWEKTVLKKVSRIITRSHWAWDYLTQEYGIPAEKIVLFQAAAALPERVIPADPIPDQEDLSTLRLLLVGREHERKGIDIAIEVLKQLNQQGVNTQLRIVGLDGENHDNIEFMGLFKKSIEEELIRYTDQYRWAHFLLHPARYDAAPIVTTEAAAFGVPTITNAVGGLATTVQDGVSGRVLPALSPAEEYVKIFRHYVENPDDYHHLRLTSRDRYEREMNWKVVGDAVADVIRQAAVKENPSNRGNGLS